MQLTRCLARRLVRWSYAPVLAGRSDGTADARGPCRAMGRKDSKSSRTSRKRDDDSWGEGWEVTHTHTHPITGAVRQLCS